MVLFNRLSAFSIQARRTLTLVWGTSRPLFIGLLLATIVAGLLPALAAWIGQRIVETLQPPLRPRAPLSWLEKLRLKLGV